MQKESLLSAIDDKILDCIGLGPCRIDNSLWFPARKALTGPNFLSRNVLNHHTCILIMETTVYQNDSYK